jgi:branched-chain amino acid transport system substrate-binding protein
MPIAAVTGLRKRLKEAGFDIVLFEAYPIGVKDLVPIVRKARDAGAEVLAGGGYTDDAILLAKAALSLKWTPKAIWHMADFGYPDFRKALGKNAAWHCGDTEWLPDAGWLGNKEFVKAYKKEYGRDPEWLAASGYGGCQILEEAVKRAGSIEDKKAVRDKMFGIERDTVFAHYKVNPLGHADAGLQIGATRMGLQYQVEKGELVSQVIYPPDIATGNFAHPFRWETL